MYRIARLILAASLLAGIVAAPVAARTPGPTIVETAIAVNATTGEFDSLIAAVVRADLADLLSGNRQFTVFAPTDAAFEDLFETLGVAGVQDIPVATLRAVLLYHVAPGERFSADVLGATRIRTISKGFLAPAVIDGLPFVNGARILIPDVDASNGVIHVIDQVLLPAG